MHELTIAIADDHALLRSGLIAMMEYEKNIRVVGEAANGLEAIELYDKLAPDILVMDVTMPKMGGIEAARIILEHHPDAKIVLMTQHEEQQFVQAMLQVNVAGCISKRAAGTEFVAALKAVARGEFYLHPAMARLAARYSSRRFVSPEETLTARERQILDHIIKGETNGQIARNLGLSIKTVEWHRSNLSNKLDTHGVADLVRYAIEHGLTSEDTPIDRL